MTAQDDFDALVRESVAPALREYGFKRSKATFHRRVEGAWQVINFQKNKWSRREHVLFTVNLGTAIDALADDPPAWSTRGWPLEYECHFRQRVSALSGGQAWESLGRWRDLRGRVRGRVIGDIKSHGLPWLDLYSNPQTLLAELVRAPESLRAYDPRPIVALANLCGTADEQRAARRALDLAIARAIDEEAAARMSDPVAGDPPKS